MNDRKTINITASETPDFGLYLSEKEKAELKDKVFAQISEIQAEEALKNTEKKKIIPFGRKILPLVAAIVLLLISATVISVSVARNNYTEKSYLKGKSHSQKANLNENDSNTKGHHLKDETSVPTQSTLGNNSIPVYHENEVEKEKQYVKLECDLPENYTLITKDDGWYSFEHSDGYNSNLNFDCEIIYCDTNWSRYFVQETGIERSTDFDPIYEMFMIGDKKAMYVSYPEDSLYTQQLFVQYRHPGYVLTILTDDGIDKDTLIELGNKIRLVTCDSSQSAAHVNFFEYLEHYSPDKFRANPAGKKIDSTSVTTLNQPVMLDGCQITVEAVTPYDNTSSFTTSGDTQNGLASSLSSNLSLFSSVDGQLLSYNRNLVIQGDGYMIPREKIVAEQQVRQKFCMVRLRIKNTGNTTVENYNTDIPLKYITENYGEYYHDGTSYKRPFIIALCQENNLPKYYSHNRNGLNLAPGQTETIQLGYFVDEDLYSKIFLSIENSIAESHIKVDLN